MNKLLYNTNERPRALLWGLLSVQHVFGMFGATVLVPILTGFPISVALFASGLGTLIYILFTKAKVPVYLGSSFAYISAVIIAKEALGGNIAAAQTGLFMVGLVYVAAALMIKTIGRGWIDRALPPVVIGPMIIIIGLGLAPVAVSSAGLVQGGDPITQIIALATLAITILAMIKAKGFYRLIPFMIGIVGGYLTAVAFGVVDFAPVIAAPWFAIPNFQIPFVNYQPYFGGAMWAIVPIAIVTISEHIGDHTVLSKICDKDFLKDPGLDNTLLGDGIATSVSALLGGPANTTYGENTAIVGMTKVASVWVTGGAAFIAIAISFIGKLTALIATVPWGVIGGVSIVLYGYIAANGLQVLIDSKVDFGLRRNVVIVSTMLVLGLGGAAFHLVGLATLSGTALAAIVGIALNLIIKAE
jgi:uracil permease